MSSERTEYLEKGAKTAAPPSKPESERNFRIGRYDFLVLQIENRIRETNESKSAETGIVAWVGDWVGEKTGAYETGKAIYSRMIVGAAKDAKELHAKLVAEFSGKTLSEAEITKLASLSERLEKTAGAKLEGVGWADAVLNTTGGKDIAPVKYAVRTVAGAAEGAYEGVAGIAEVSGKSLAILAAYSLEPQARSVIEEDLKELLSHVTWENVGKVLAALPGALEEFQKLPADKQLEWASKLVGSVIVPLGIGAKAVQAGKTLGKAGMETAKAGMEKVAKGGRAAMVGVAMVAGWTAETALAETGIVAGMTVRYAGEMGGWRVKNPTIHDVRTPPPPRAAPQETRFAEELRQAERAVETAASSWDRLTALMRRDIALERAHPGSVPPMQLKMATEAVTRWDGAMKLPKGGPRETEMGKIRMTFEKAWTQEALRNHTAKTVADAAIGKAAESSKRAMGDGARGKNG